MKRLRVAGACTLEDANRYLAAEFLPWWNQHLVSAPANAADAHRPLGRSTTCHKRSVGSRRAR